jgi:hypothetical protein
MEEMTPMIQAATKVISLASTVYPI